MKSSRLLELRKKDEAWNMVLPRINGKSDLGECLDEIEKLQLEIERLKQKLEGKC